MGGGIAETELSDKRVTADVLDRMVQHYRRAPGDVWLIDASRVTSFSPDSVSHAVEHFVDLNRRLGLRVIVAVITSPLVRMGAATASMSLRALKSPIEIVVVESRAEAIRRAHALRPV
ncbi:MAG: hypothetical protein KF729_30850 [Sandaracinaceae bacterium]|nr:hypothetical protein [Sandaracinaceae bacterium]